MRTSRSFVMRTSRRIEKLTFRARGVGCRVVGVRGYLVRGDSVISVADAHRHDGDRSDDGTRTLNGCIVRAGGAKELLILRQPQRQKSCSPGSASTAERAVPGQDWPQGNLYNDRRTHLNRRAKAGGVWSLRRRGTPSNVSSSLALPSSAPQPLLAFTLQPIRPGSSPRR